MRFLIILALFGASVSAAQSQDFGPLSRLINGCYRADLPLEERAQLKIPASDQHCFNWMLGNSLVKDVHVYHAPDMPPVKGETVYAFIASGILKLTHYADVGGIVTTQARIEDATTLIYSQESPKARSRLRLVADGYELVTEELKNGIWVETTKLSYRRVAVE